MPPNATRTIGKRLTRAALCAWRFSWITYLPGWPDLRHYLPSWPTIAATRGAQLRNFVSVMITTLNPERIVLTDDSSRFAERTSILTDARRHTIADVLAAFASFPWTRANDKSVGQVDRLVALWREGTMA
jgi:hypothetical protein